MRRTIFNLEDIKSYENVSAAVSKKYVPIKTSDFVKSLSKSFKLSHGGQYRRGSSAHYVEMTKGDSSEVKLYIENSFDGNTALRVAFNYNGFIFGRIKQVHRGKPAIDMNASIDEVNEWYSNAIGSIDAMRDIDIDRKDMEAIAGIVMKTRGIPNLRMITNMNYKHDCALDFVMYLVKMIREGGFMRTTPKGPIMLKPVTQESLVVRMNNKIWNYLSKNNPELYV